jgi:glycosyltransferase involved in cell wall biosynthesis
LARRQRNRSLRVVLYEPSGHGGICHYTHQLAEALVRQGCDVTLATTETYELERLPRRFRVQYVFKRSRLRRVLQSARSLGGRRKDARGEATEGPFEGPGRGSSLVEALRAVRLRLLHASLAVKLLLRRPDVVHLQTLGRERDLFLVRLLVRMPFPVVWTAHDLLPHDSKSTAERNALAEIYRRVDRIIVHAESNRAEMTEMFGIDPRKILRVPHGSYDLFLPEGRIERGEARARLGFPSEAQIVLFFGLIKRYKGLEFLVEAFRRIAPKTPPVTLAIVGGLFRDADGYDFYRGLLEGLSREKNVICVPDYVPLDRVGLYFCAADVVVLPYTKTYQSGVLLAAYAAGRPVVVTDTGGLSELVEADGTGFVVPPRDPAALADAITRLLEDGPRAAAMGERASYLARTKYSWERIAGETVRVFHSLIEERSPRRARRRFPKKFMPFDGCPAEGDVEEGLHEPEALFRPDDGRLAGGHASGTANE